jgi:transcriptional regulator with XRE-family HTH domain
MIMNMSNVIDFPTPVSTSWSRVAAEVRAEAARRNVNQKQLATLTGISTSTLNRRFNPKEERDSFQVFELERIASVLGVSLTRFFSTVDRPGGDDGGGPSHLGESNPRPIHYLRTRTTRMPHLSDTLDLTG